jgi:tripartite-type tricarboxylate transporter receptor subunit TctC
MRRRALRGQTSRENAETRARIPCDVLGAAKFTTYPTDGRMKRIVSVFPDISRGRRHALALAIAIAVGLFAPVASAQPFPSKPVRLVIPFPPGGSLDNVGRLIAQKLSELWGQSVVVENKPGAGGNIGADYVAKSPPDGYTIVMGALSTHAVNPSLYPSMPYDARRDFAPVSLVAITPNVLIVNGALPVQSVRDLVAFAKASPGKVNFGSGSNGSGGHLAGELFRIESGTDVQHIPFKGGAPALQALLAGDTQFMFDNLANAMAQVKGGKVRAIAVTTAQRSRLAPELPTMAEQGMPGFDISTWFGMMLPAGTPKDVVARWNADLVKVLGMPDVREKMLAQGAEPAPMTPEQFGAFIDAELVKYARIVKLSGAKVD